MYLYRSVVGGTFFFLGPTDIPASSIIAVYIIVVEYLLAALCGTLYLSQVREILIKSLFLFAII